MVLPGYIREAARGGTASDLETIKDWLDNGGEVDDYEPADRRTILMVGISYERIEVVKLALSHGADVNKPGDLDVPEAPLFSVIGVDDIDFILDAISLLLDAGARINAAAPTALDDCYIAGETALSYAIDWFRFDNDDYAEKGLACVSLLLRRGAKLDNCWGGRSAEDCLRHVANPIAFERRFPGLQGCYSITRPPIETKAQFIACKKLIADERRRRYMLPRRAFLRLRSLQLRGRANPDAFLAAVARLPNELAWHVLSFWPAEADVAPPPPSISDEALLSELDGLVQAQANSR